MATRVISTSIKLDGEAEFKKQLSSANGELRNLKSEMTLVTAQFDGQANSMEALTAKQDILTREIEQQTEKVSALESALQDATAAYGDSDKRTDQYRQSLNKAKAELIDMERELQDNTRYLDEARSNFNKTADSIDEFGNAVKDASGGSGSGGLSGLIGSLGELKNVLVGGAVVGGAKELADAIFDITDSTKEYRSIMGSLEVSSAQLGYSTDQTAEAYNRLYGVLGDTQTAATTVANLQAIELSQEDLMTMIDAVTGAWNQYGDSIPIDGLAESINETIRAGEVTGTFADVLNWGSDELETFGVKLKEDTEANAEWNQAVQDATTSEDYFNLALQECGTKAERTQLMLNYLAENGLAEAGQAWRDVNADIVAANEAQSDWDAAVAELGEFLSPAADALRSFGADSVEWVTEKIKGAVEWVQKLVSWFKDFNQTLNDQGAARTQAGIDAMNARIDGSHAGGLRTVPYDGYVAELHKNESVLTADEASVWRTLTSSPARQQSGVTAEELQKVTSAAVNAMCAIQQSGAGGDLRIEFVVNGQKFSEAILPDFRNVSRSNPEVVND